MNYNPDPSTSPIVFWAMFGVSMMSVGVLLRHEAQAWYLRWQMHQGRDRTKNAPSVMRQRIRDLEVSNNSLLTENARLKMVAETLTTEKDRLNERCKFMARELKFDPLAKTMTWEHAQRIGIKPPR